MLPHVSRPCQSRTSWVGRIIDLCNTLNHPVNTDQTHPAIPNAPHHFQWHFIKMGYHHIATVGIKELSFQWAGFTWHLEYSVIMAWLIFPCMSLAVHSGLGTVVMFSQGLECTEGAPQCWSLSHWTADALCSAQRHAGFYEVCPSCGCELRRTSFTLLASFLCHWGSDSSSSCSFCPSCHLLPQVLRAKQSHACFEQLHPNEDQTSWSPLGMLLLVWALTSVVCIRRCDEYRTPASGTAASWGRFSFPTSQLGKKQCLAQATASVGSELSIAPPRLWCSHRCSEPRSSALGNPEW